MGRRVGKKMKGDNDDGIGTAAAEESDSSDTSSFNEEKKKSEKYEDFRIPNYVRYYPDNGGIFEYIVFLESANNELIGSHDMMTVANCLDLIKELNN